VQEQRTEMPVRKTVSRTAPATVPRLPVEDIRMLMGVVGKEVGTVVKALAGRVDDLEQRLASVEALLAEARGSSQ
jgi:hypothetical protein